MAAILTATVEAMTAITNNGASNAELETIVFEAVTVAPETIDEAEVISIVLVAVWTIEVGFGWLLVSAEKIKTKTSKHMLDFIWILHNLHLHNCTLQSQMLVK